MVQRKIAAATPGLTWRVGSSAVMGITGMLSKAFLYGFNNVEVTGLEPFLETLDRRRKNGRKRGLLTGWLHSAGLLDYEPPWLTNHRAVCNHLSVSVIPTLGAGHSLLTS